jgi:hypothetical protein
MRPFWAVAREEVPGRGFFAVWFVSPPSGFVCLSGLARYLVTGLYEVFLMHPLSADGFRVDGLDGQWDRDGPIAHRQRGRRRHQVGAHGRSRNAA